MRIREKCIKLILFFLVAQTHAENALSNQPGSLPATSQTSQLSTNYGNLILQFGGFSTYESSKHVYIEANDGDYFNISNHYRENFLLGLGYLINGPDETTIFGCQTFKTQYGVNAFYLPRITVKGNVIQEQEFNNLSFKYSVTNYPIYLAAKGIFNTNDDRYKFTLDLGLGPNIIHASNFNEKSLDGGHTIPDNIFSNHTSVALSGTFGLGIRFENTFGNIPLECGYRFFYLGQGHFKAIHSDLNNTLETGNGYTNALLCSVAV